MYYFAFNLLLVWLIYSSFALLAHWFILVVVNYKAPVFATTQWSWELQVALFQSTAYILFYATQIADWSFLYVYFS